MREVTDLTGEDDFVGLPSGSGIGPPNTTTMVNSDVAPRAAEDADIIILSVDQRGLPSNSRPGTTGRKRRRSDAGTCASAHVLSDPSAIGPGMLPSQAQPQRVQVRAGLYHNYATLQYCRPSTSQPGHLPQTLATWCFSIVNCLLCNSMWTALEGPCHS